MFWLSGNSMEGKAFEEFSEDPCEVLSAVNRAMREGSKVLV